MTSTSSLPLLILCGALGSGKTTMLQNMLDESRFLRAVNRRKKLLLLINDYAAENMDAMLVSRSVGGSNNNAATAAGGAGGDDGGGITAASNRSHNSNNTTDNHDDDDDDDKDSPSPSPDTFSPLSLPAVAPLTNGCVCCNLLKEYLEMMVRATRDRTSDEESERNTSLAGGHTWEYAILECTGLADATPVVTATLMHPVLRTRVRIDAVVCVVDGFSFSIKKDVLRGSQLHGVNLVVVNKATTAKEEHLKRMRRCSSQRHGSSQPHQQVADDMGDGARTEWWPELEKEILSEASVANAHVRVVATDFGRLDYDACLVNRNLFEADKSKFWYLEQADGLDLDARIDSLAAREEETLGVISLCFQGMMPCSESAGGDSTPPPAMREDTAATADVVITQPPTLDVVLRGVKSLLQLRSVVPPLSAAAAEIVDGGVTATSSRAVKKYQRGIWRSKGFFFAYDEHECTSDDEQRQRQQQHPMTEGAPSPQLLQPPSKSLKQFSWSSSGKFFDYAEVLKPWVRLPLSDSGFKKAGTNNKACIADLVLIGMFDEEAVTSQLHSIFGGQMMGL